VFLGEPVFFSAAGDFFFRGGRFIKINITITLSYSLKLINFYLSITLPINALLL